MASASVSVTSLACVTATVLNAFVASVSTTFAVFAVANVAVLPTVSAPDCVTLPLAVTVRSLPMDDFPSTMASASRYIFSLRNRNRVERVCGFRQHYVRRLCRRKRSRVTHR